MNSHIRISKVVSSHIWIYRLSKINFDATDYMNSLDDELSLIYASSSMIPGQEAPTFKNPLSYLGNWKGYKENEASCRVRGAQFCDDFSKTIEIWRNLSSFVNEG